MPIETERKFLVVDDTWRQNVTRRRCLRQAYLANCGDLSVRIRLDGQEAAMLTIKVAESSVSRHEYEYAIPIADAEALLAHCGGGLIVKVRHEVAVGDALWEIDVFEGDNHGLVLAEIELGHADQQFERPMWLGVEVSTDRRYYNSELARTPFASW